MRSFFKNAPSKIERTLIAVDNKYQVRSFLAIKAIIFADHKKR